MASKSDPDRSPGPTPSVKPAPGDLRLLQAFLNTESLDPESPLGTPRKFADWLERQGLAAPGTQVDDGGMKRAVDVREAVRTWLARGPEASVAAAAERLDQAMASATIRTRYTAGGRIGFEPIREGLDAALARLGGILAQAQFEGNT